MARYELNLRDYYYIIRRHIVVLVAVSLFVGGLTFLQTPTDIIYRANATVRITRVADLAGLLIQTFYWSPEDNIATQTKLISSQPVLLKIAHRLELIPGDITLNQALHHPYYATIIDDLSGRIEARQLDYSSLVEITAVGGTEQQAIQLARAAAMAFADFSYESLNERTLLARQFIERRLQIVSDRLDSTQTLLSQTHRRRPGRTLPDQESLAPLADRRQELLDLQRYLNDQRNRLRRGLDLPVGLSPPAGLSRYSTYLPLATERAGLQAERRRLLATYTVDAEPIRLLDEQLADLRLRLIDAITSDLQGLTRSIADQDEALAAFPTEEVALAELERVVTLNTQLLTELESSFQEVQIREAEQPREVSVLNLPARAHASGPQGQHLKALIGLLLGLMIGIVLAFILETLDTSIGKIEDVEESLEVPVLTVIPHLGIEKVAARLIEQTPALAEDPHLDMYARLITHYDPRSPAAEAYRTLRTNMQFATAGKVEDASRKNTFLFSSASLQEGKSTTIINLAITMAQAGHRVLLLSCNMRRPTIYKSFGIPRERGMVDILTGGLPWRECVKGVTDMMVGPLSLQGILSMPGLDNLSIITTGGIPPNPSELLSSTRFSRLIEEVKQEFDYVLVDCPPILPVTDAAIVARQVDWVVLVYQVGKVPRNAIRRAKSHLENVGGHILGIAMNDVKSEISGYSPYSQYMVRYYGEEAGTERTLLKRLGGWLRREKKKPHASSTTDHLPVSPKKTPVGTPCPPHMMEAAPFRTSQPPSPTGETKEAPPSALSLPYAHSSEPAVPPQAVPPRPATAPEGPEAGPGRRFLLPLWIWGVLLLFALALFFFLSGGLGLLSDSPDPVRPAAADQASGHPPTASPGLEPAGEPAETTQADWSVQTGSFDEAARAWRLRDRLIDRLPELAGQTGLIWIAPVDIPGLGVWHRVYAGRTTDRAEAEVLARRIHDSGLVAQALVVRVGPGPP